MYLFRMLCLFIVCTNLLAGRQAFGCELLIEGNMLSSVAKWPERLAGDTNRLLLINSLLCAALLACTMIPALSLHFTGTFVCPGLILVLIFLGIMTRRAAERLSSSVNGDAGTEFCRKTRVRIFAWAVLVSSAILTGAGPVADPASYSVDSFQRIIGFGVINDYSVSKKIHYFYCALIVFGLLIFSLYQSFRIALLRNPGNKTRRLGVFSDTLLFAGWSFLLVCVYRQFSEKYSFDLTLCLLKSVLIFMIPAFFLWGKGKLLVQDVRTLLALAFLSLVLSVCTVLFFDAGGIPAGFSIIFAASLFMSLLAFAVNREFGLFSSSGLCSKALFLCLLGSCSIVIFSFCFELSNILALKSGSHYDVGTAGRVLFCVFFLTAGWYFVPRRLTARRTAGLALFAFALGIGLIEAQPSLVIRPWFDIYESANYAVPISDFLNYAKIPLFENFPGHGLSGLISSIAYGDMTGDYKAAMFQPWSGWLYSAVFISLLYSFVRRISSGFTALSAVILLPCFARCGCGMGFAVLMPFFLYAGAQRKKYLVLTAFLAIFLVAYRLDLGFAFLAALLGSSLCVSLFYGGRMFYRVLISLAIGGAAVLALFLLTCALRDINPLSRIQQFLSIASSNDHWGYGTLGDREKTAYSFFFM